MLKTIPHPPYFTQSDRPAAQFSYVGDVTWDIRISEHFRWAITVTDSKNPALSASATIGMLELPEVVELTGTMAQANGQPLYVTIPELFKALCCGYSYEAALEQPLTSEGRRPRIAITTIAGLNKGGGTIQLYRHANWLVDQGYEVTIYANDAEGTPQWANLRCPYRCIKDEAQRYAAITEEIVVVYSLLEIPTVLRHLHSPRQRVVHLCQGLEEFHFGTSPSNLLASKPFFQILNALPVGRIVASTALQKYFAQEYLQKTYLIQNGIEDSYYASFEKVLDERNLSKEPVIKLLQVANPRHALKLCGAVLEAAIYLGLRYTTSNVHVTFVSGPKPVDTLKKIQLPANVSYTVKAELSSHELKALYRDAHVVINGSLHEGFGLSTIEAMAVGTCVVQADNFGLSDIIIDGEHALKVPRNNVTHLATACASLLENPGLRNRITSNARRLSEAFTIENQYNHFVGVWSELLQQQLHPQLSQVAGSSNAPEPSSIVVREPASFSVLVPIYNHGHFLPTTLNTLRAQSYPYWEAILVNDGSTDDTAEVMRTYASMDSRFKTFHKSNGGTASALNKALENASHEWVCWLSSDDFFKPDKLAIHAQCIESFPDISFFHTLFSTYNDETQKEDFTIPPTHRLGVHPQFQSLTLLVWNYVHGNTVAIKRELFRKVGNFNGMYPNAQDYDMWLRMSNQARFYLINKVTCTTRIHAQAGTSQFPQAGTFDSYRAAISFLNTRRFDEIVPDCNTNDVSDLVVVMSEAIKVMMQPSAFLYQGVSFEKNPFIERFFEWYLPYARRVPQVRNKIMTLVSAYSESAMQDPKYPKELLGHLTKFLEPLPETFRYKPVDPEFEYVLALQLALHLNQGPAVQVIGRYLRKLQKHKILNEPELDSILNAVSPA